MADSQFGGSVLRSTSRNSFSSRSVLEGFSNVDRIPEHGFSIQVSNPIGAGQNERDNHRPEHFCDRGDPFSCEVDVKDGGVRPLRPQQGQGCTDVCRGAENLEAGALRARA